MSLIHYLLEANLYLVAFYLLYVLLLRNTTLYQLNRAYLLLTSLVAFIIPLLQLGILKPQVIATANMLIEPEFGSGTIVPAVVEAPKWTMADYGLALYSVVALAMLALLIFKIIKLIALSKKGITKQAYGLKLIEIPGQNVAFSFFGYLFVNSELISSPTILHHEEIHIRQKHSWDVIWFEIVRIINWFNPVVYLLQKSIKEVHEFIADHEVARTEKGAADYADFLISNAYGLTPIQLTNSFFNKNLLKRRIIMLYQKPSGKAARLKYLLTLPLAGGLLCLSTMAFTNKDYGWDVLPKNTLINVGKTQSQQLLEPVNTPETPNHTQSQLVKNTPEPSSNQLKIVEQPAKHELETLQIDTPLKRVEVLPMFPGGYQAFGQFLVKNIRYPALAKENNVMGRVFVKFVVEKDGSLTDMKILRDPGMGLGNEAVRVLKLSPNWTPGMQKGQPVRVEFTVPVNFSLDTNKVKQPNQITLPPPPPNDQTIFNSVEINPTFPGGEAAFAKFLADNVKYPKEAKDANVTGRVFLQFVVEKDGSLSDFKIVRDPGKGLGEEGLRVLKLSPKWKPGVQNGRPVRVQYVVPINFSLAK